MGAVKSGQPFYSLTYKDIGLPSSRLRTVIIVTKLVSPRLFGGGVGRPLYKAGLYNSLRGLFAFSNWLNHACRCMATFKELITDKILPLTNERRTVYCTAQHSFVFPRRQWSSNVLLMDKYFSAIYVQILKMTSSAQRQTAFSHSFKDDVR